ncbi:MAG: glycosyltransferase, partial [Patescibacteria group bacterium]
KVPDDKFIVVPNGIVWDDLQGEACRDPFLLLNTSSPDRSLSALLRGFRKIKAQVPQARLQWAYGWGVYDVNHADNPTALEWKRKMEAEIASTDGFIALGRVNHGDVAKLYQKASVLAYPTAFYEIDCLSARKAQAGGCLPVATNFAALDTTVKFGTKVKVDEAKENWGKPYTFDFAIQDEATLDLWVAACVEALRKPMSEEARKPMREWAKQYEWTVITDIWHGALKT